MPDRTRFVWLCIATLQLLVPVTASIADARLHAQDAAAKRHIEAAGTKGCPRVHPEDCGLCRTIGARALGGSALVAPAPLVAERCVTLELGSVSFRPTTLFPQSRAPPLLS